jgi:hypothetical protein
VRLAARSEQPVPGGQLVDVSATGVLAAFDGRQYLGIEYASMDEANTRRLRTLVERYEASGT